MRIFLALATAGLLGVAIWTLRAVGLPRYHLHAAEKALAEFHAAEAKEHLSSCLQRWPQDVQIHLLAARAARLDDDVVFADAELKECERLGWTPAVALERAMLRAQQGDLDDVESYLRHQVEEDQPNTIFVLDALTRGYLRVYRFGLAQYALKLWLERQPDSIQALLCRGYMWERLQNHADAVQDFRHILALDSNCTDARLGLANALQEEAQPEEALQHLEELRKQQPHNTDVLVSLACCQNTLNHSAEALAILDEVLADHPDYAPAVQGRAQVALQQGKPDEAEQWARKARDLNPYDYQTNYLLYECLQQCGKQEEAKKQFAEAERIKESILRMQELGTHQLQSTPDDPAVRTEMGKLCLGLGKEEAGLGWLLSALHKAPEYKPAHEALAKYYDSKGDKEKSAYHRRKVGGG